MRPGGLACKAYAREAGDPCTQQKHLPREDKARPTLIPAQTKISNLQAVRAFAAIIVAFFHTGYVYGTLHAVGSFGVDIFFVLSGYIMARICEKTPTYFLRRRLIRIVPPYWTLTLLLFAVASRFPQLMGNTRPHVSELLKSLFFIPFFKESGLIRPLLFVGWSLNYEMLFYLLIWISLFLLPRWPLLLPSAVIVAGHIAAAAAHPQGVLGAFLAEPFILEFPLGALAYYLARAVPAAAAVRWRWGSLGLVLGCTGALVLLQLFRPPLSHTAEGSLYDLLSMLVVLGTSLLSQGGWDTRLAWVVLIGDASYVLYLAHPYCEYFQQRVLAPHLALLRTDQLPGSILAVMVSIGVGVLLHIYAERPTLVYLNERFGGHRKGAEFPVLVGNKRQKGTR